LSSHKSAHSIKASATGKEMTVLEALRKHGPMTTHKIAEMTGLTVVTVSPRIKPLRKKGLVEDSGARESGRSIWRVVGPKAVKKAAPTKPAKPMKAAAPAKTTKAAKKATKH
jgi:DNA-binding MarR family transcriptional regulator